MGAFTLVAVLESCQTLVNISFTSQYLSKRIPHFPAQAAGMRLGRTSTIKNQHIPISVTFIELSLFVICLCNPSGLSWLPHKIYFLLNIDALDAQVFGGKILLPKLKHAAETALQ